MIQNLQNYSQYSTDPGNYLSYGASVSEEDVANVKPVTQTIKTDPTTGEQMMTVSGRPQDLSADNPLTPTILPAGQPAEPMAPMAAEAPMQAQPIQLARAPTATMTDVPNPYMPNPWRIPPEIQRRRDEEALQIKRNELIRNPNDVNLIAEIRRDEKKLGQQAAAPMQVAAAPVTTRTDVTAPTTGVVSPAPAMAAPAPAVTPGAEWTEISPGSYQLTSEMQTPPTYSALETATKSGDIRGMANALGTAENPAVKRAAGIAVADELRRQKEQADAERKAASMTPVEMGNVLRQKTPEGSIFKAYLYGRLGLTKLAEDEQIKLGAGTHWISGARINPDTKQMEHGLVQVDGRGMPVMGIKADGKDMDGKDIVQYTTFGAAAKGAKIESNLYDASKGGKKGYTRVTYPGGMSIVYDPTNNLVTDAKILSNLNKGGAEGTQEERMALATAKADIRYTYAAPIAAQTAQGRVLGEAGGMGQPAGTPLPVPGGPAAAPAAARPAAAATLGQIPTAEVTGAVAPTAIPATGAAPTAPIVNAPVAPSAVGGAPAAPTRPSPAGPRPGETIGQQQAREKTERAVEQARQLQPITIGTEQAKANIGVSADAQKNFNDYVDKTIVPQAITGLKISTIRRQQLNELTSHPEIAGIMATGGTAGTELGNIIRDLVTGEKDSIELNKRLVGLNLQNTNPAAYNSLITQIRLQQELGPLTIKDTAPVGAISDSEQKMNTANQVDVTRNPAVVSFNLVSKNQFLQDLQQARAAYRTQHPEIKTTGDFESSWAKERARLQKEYDSIYAARAKYIGSNKNTPAAAVDGYRHYPVPEWDAEKTTWTYKNYSAQARRPAGSSRPALDNFEK
jgi:hypothetical protein